jgi:uncharacterized protein YcbK (DUF882 family)
MFLCTGRIALLYNPPMPRIIALISCVLFILFIPAGANSAKGTRTLKFYHTHTLETLEVTYYEDGRYLLEPMEQLRVFLADWRNGDQHHIDPKLMDILWEIQRVTGNNDTYEVISAYRSMETNRYLRSKSKGVAQNSQHVLGKAIDVRLRGLDTRKLRDTALELKLGGVGYYEKTDFVHVDTGRVRRW